MIASLGGKAIQVTGAARRLGKVFALSCARAGADVVIHHAHSDVEAKSVQKEILAGIFGTLSLDSTSLEDWQRHLQINLTAPFLWSQAFARQAQEGGRIVNILDWRATAWGGSFPVCDQQGGSRRTHKSSAMALAPAVTVNGLALGAILPPINAAPNPDIIKNVPLKRWANATEVEEALVFLLTCPSYIPGEILHLDGERHLV